MARHPFTSKDVGRVSAFSDAIFAIALTLPVLELRLPAGSAPLLPQLQESLPAFFAYLVTFALGASQWLAHYRLFDAAELIDEQVLNRNVLFLFLFSLLPFTTALVMNRGNESIAIVVYALNVAALAQALAWVTRRLLTCKYVRGDHVAAIEHSLDRSYALSAVFVLEAVLALFVPTVALFTPVLVPIALRLADRIARAHEDRR